MHSKRDVALDPQAQALLEQMNAMEAQAGVGDRILSPTQALVASREAYRASIPLAGEPEPVESVYERQIPSSAGNILVRIYKQKSSQ